MKLKWPGFDAKTVAAIEDYLNLDELAEIVWREGQGPGVDRWELERVAGRGVYHYIARGRSVASNHSRPMIELFEDGVGSGMSGPIKESCPDCDDWSRTAVCSLHPELSLEEIEWHRAFDRRRQYTEFGPENHPNRVPQVPRPSPADFQTALESLRNRYVRSFEVGQHSVPVWTIDTGA